jgi:hypothetical protein
VGISMQLIPWRFVWWTAQSWCGSSGL